MFTVVICFFAILFNNALGYQTSPANIAGSQVQAKPVAIKDSKVNSAPIAWAHGIKK